METINIPKHNSLTDKDTAGNHAKIIPAADSTTALQITKANGTTAVVNVDTTNERVGIGTTTPVSALDCRGDAYFGSRTTAITSPGQVNITQETNGGEAKLYFSSKNAIGQSTDHSIISSGGNLTVRAVSQAADRLFIQTGTGNVGIGTTTPASKLEVKNSAVNTTGIALQRSGGTQQIVRLFEDANGRGVVRVLDEATTDKIYLAADGDCYINPLNSGKLGIGTTTPAEKLDVNGNIKSNALQINADSGTADTDDALYFGGRTTEGSGRLRYDATTQTFYFEKRGASTWAVA